MDNEAFEDNEGRDVTERPTRRGRKTGISAIFIWRELVSDLIESHGTAVRLVTVLTLGLAYHAYFAYCVYR